MTDHDALAARVRADRDHAHPCDCEHDDCIHDRAYQDAPVYGDLCDAYLDLYDEAQRLRAERDRFEACLDAADKMDGLSDRGSMWRFWAEKAQATADANKALRVALANALDACRIVDAAAKEGHDRIGDLVLHMLSAVEPARAALKGGSDE